MDRNASINQEKRYGSEKNFMFLFESKDKLEFKMKF